MKKSVAVFLVLVLFLLPACGEAPSLPSSMSIAVPSFLDPPSVSLPASSEASSLPTASGPSVLDLDLNTFEEYRNAESWQHAYYELALTLNIGTYLELYFPASGADPVLGVGFNVFNIDTVWCLKDGIPAVAFERKALPEQGLGERGKIFYQKTNGTPVYCVWSWAYGEYDAYYRVADTVVTPLCERIDGSIYLYTEGRSLSRQEEVGWYPRQAFGLSSASRHLYEDTRLIDPSVTPELYRRLLLEYFFGITLDPNTQSQSTISEEAPTWVSTYLGYIRACLNLSILNGDLLGSQLYYVQPDPIDIVFMPPAYPGGPPVLYVWGGYLVGYEDGYSFYLHETEAGFMNYMAIDQNGLVYNHFYDEYGTARFTRFSQYGPKTIVHQIRGDEGDDPYASEGICYSNGEVFAYDNWDELNEWRDAKQQEAMRLHGFVPPYTILEEVARYPLPEDPTWPELETALIDIFCTHAQAIGQWNA